MKKTKIVCTIGPSCADKETIKQMISAGMNVARFNFSHGSQQSHLEMVNMVRAARNEMGVPLAILVDTKGPEIRVKDFENGSVNLSVGKKFVLTTKDIVGTEQAVSITYSKLPKLVKKGTTILLNDGNIELKVISSSATDIETKVVSGGKLSNKKSINVPSIDLEMPYISEQDRSDIEFACKTIKADIIAISFVNKKEDVLAVRKLLNDYGRPQMKIVSKIESRAGVDNAHEIIEVSDGIMVARGDLGVEIDFAKVPVIQKQLIAECNAHGKLVITATQMMESMTENVRPTRAEISDVANAIFDGTCAIMTSGETSVGKHPVLVVKTMADIAAQAEETLGGGEFMYYEPEHNQNFYTSLGYATSALNYSLNSKLIVSATCSGASAIGISNYKPACTILGCTFQKDTYHLLSAYYGVVPMLRQKLKSIDAQIDDCVEAAKQSKLAKKGDMVIITCGNATVRDGSNCIIVEKIK